MLLRTLFIVFMAFVLAPQAFAQTQPSHAPAPQNVQQAQPPKQPIMADWISCRANQDCVMVGAECGAPQGVNRQYVKPFLKKFGTAISTQCGRAPTSFTSVEKTAVVECQNSRCVAYVPNTVMDPSWYACTKDQECVQTTDMCNTPMAVSILHRDDYDDFVQHIHSLGGTPPCRGISPEIIAWMQSKPVVCMQNRCILSPFTPVPPNMPIPGRTQQ